MKYTHLSIFIFLLVYKIVYFDDLHFMNTIELHGSHYYILGMKRKLAHIEFEKSYLQNDLIIHSYFQHTSTLLNSSDKNVTKTHDRDRKS